MEIELENLIHRLDGIYECGLLEDNVHTRMAYSPEDRKGREKFLEYAHKIGLSHRIDEAGNLIVFLQGKDPSLPSILMGSHLDTVPNGGKYDGAYGCVAALSVLEAYVKAKKQPMHTLEIIVFTDEEGFRFGKGLLGSSVFCGLDPEIDNKEMDIFGNPRDVIMEKFGCNLKNLSNAIRKRETVLCFLELHIEQGARLDRHGTSVGIVSSIAGVNRYEITVQGEANHAGSTAMVDRKDALVAASTFISQIPEVVKRYGNEFTVATVGTIRVTPHSVNVIPGTCTFSLEIRDQDESTMNEVESELNKLIHKICIEQNQEFCWKKTSTHSPAPMTDWIKKEIEESVKKLDYSYEILPSGAFHDALIMSTVFPTGMIFVPSVKGISHSQYEFTKEEDLKKGCDVLLHTVMAIDNIR